MAHAKKFIIRSTIHSLVHLVSTLGMQVLSFNELGMEKLLEGKKQIVVMVVSSTGEGDPPDNSARFYGHSK